VTNLLTAEEIIAASVPASVQCGIYFLIKDGELKYVGQSVNIGARIGAHGWRGFDRWHFIVCPRDQLDAIERAYLDRFLPPWNDDGRTARLREEIKRANTPLGPLAPLPFEGVGPAHLAACAAENAEYAATHWTDDRVMRERLRRTRMVRHPNPLAHADFEPMPQVGDLLPENEERTEAIDRLRAAMDALE
jgi:hypothetical protein